MSSQDVRTHASNAIESRIVRTEQQLASLAGEQRALTENVASLASHMKELSSTMASSFQRVDNQIDSLGSKLVEQTKPQWQTIAAMFGVTVIVIGWFAKSEIAPILVEQETARQYMRELKNADAATAEQNSQSRERIVRLEEIRRLEEAGMLKQKGAP